jgi:hypothetical protein
MVVKDKDSLKMAKKFTEKNRADPNISPGAWKILSMPTLK